MKRLFNFLYFLSIGAFAQYVPQASITSKKSNKSYEIKDVRFLHNGKMIQFKLNEFNNMYAYAKLKEFDLNYDKSKEQQTVPEIRDVYYYDDLGYADGVYKTKEDFIGKNPLYKDFTMKTNMASGMFENPKDLVNFYDPQSKFPEYQQRDYFAVVKNGDVYFNIKEIKKLSKDLKVPLAHEIPNFAYVRVKAGTEKNLYFELNKTVNRYTGLEMFGAVGAIASVIVNNNANKKTSESASDIYANYIAEGFILPDTNYIKGVVFETQSKEFKILTFCEDLNTYLKSYNSELVVDCEKEYLIDKQREIISKL